MSKRVEDVQHQKGREGKGEMRRVELRCSVEGVEVVRGMGKKGLEADGGGGKGKVQTGRVRSGRVSLDGKCLSGPVGPGGGGN